MEMKNMLPTNSRQMLVHHLKEKKNWTLLTFVILAVTVVVLPLLAEATYLEEFIYIGVIEIFVIVFVNCIIDFNYLHDTRKYGYYLSKPLNNVKRLNIILLSNMLFAAFFMGLLMMVAFVNKSDVGEIFTISCGWLTMVIFLSALSSYLSGNSIIAAIATAFNFGIPLMILGVIYFAMDIVSDMAVGFNVDIMLSYFIDHIYRIDIIYLMKFVDYPNWLMYFAYLIALCVGIYAVTLLVIRNRKNERIGQHLVFNGYKNFVSLMVTLIVPFIFTSIMSSNESSVKLISFVILGSVSYYVALVILEKSFRLKAVAYKILGVFMVSFVVLVFATGMIVKSYENNFPELEDIEGVLLTRDQWIYIEGSDIKGEFLELKDVELKHDQYKEVRIYTSREAIKAILEIHKSLVEDTSYWRYANINFVYYLDDGSTTRRYYSIEPTGDFNHELDDLSQALEQTEEFKEVMMPFIYVEEYANEFRNATLDIHTQQDTVTLFLTDERFDSLRRAMRIDADNILSEGFSDFETTVIGNSLFYLNDKFSKEHGYDEPNKNNYSIRLYGGSGYEEYFDITNSFTHTRAFFEEYIN